MTFCTLKLYQGDGVTLIGELPSFKQVQPMVTLNDVGVLNLDYPVNGIRASNLYSGNELEIALVIDGAEQARYLVEDDGRSEVDTDLNKAVLKISGREESQLLDRAKVYPINGVGVEPYNYPFTAATPGTILNTLIAAAQGRGALTGWTTDFSGTVDSNGTAWGSTVTFAYKPSASVLDVVKHLSQTLGLIDWKVGPGRVLHAYKANTFMAQNRTGAVFSRGRDFTKSEVDRTKRDIANVVIVEGDNNTQIIREDDTSISARGRYEDYFSQSGVTDVGTLDVVGDLQLSYRSVPRIAYPVSVNFRAKTPKPFADYGIGDYVYVEDTQYRVVQMSLTLTSSAVLSGDLDFNDKFDSREVVAARIIQALSGNIGTGQPVIANQDTTDNTTPSAPEAPGVTSQTYLSVQDVQAAVEVSWSAVTTNTDSSTINDLQGYEVQWKYTSDASGGWRVAGTTSATFFNFSPVLVNRSIDVRLRAFDYNGHYSDFSPTTTATTATDDVAPPVPSTPILDVATLPLLARVTWDGKDDGGATEEGNGNFQYVKVHASTVNDFTPTAATLKTTITGETLFPIEWPANTPIFVKFVAVSRSGVESAPSAQGTGTVRQAADGEITSISATKITAGIIGSDIVISGRFTTALLGDRREMNSIGFQAWDSSENLTISLDGVNNLLTGVFKTALNDTRIEIGAGGTTGRITFYNSAGVPSILESTTYGGTFTNLALRYPITNTPDGWNALNITDQEVTVFNSGAFIFNYGGGAAAGEFVVGSVPTVRGQTNIPATVVRLAISDSGAAMYTVDGTQYLWLQEADNNFRLYGNGPWNNTTPLLGGNINIQAPPIYVESPLTTWWTPPDPSFSNSQWGGLLYMALDPNTHTNPRFEFKNWDAGSYFALWAAAFTVSSDSRMKNNIEEYQGSALNKIRSTKVMRYQRYAAKPYNKDGDMSTEMQARLNLDAPYEIGLTAQDAPDEIVKKDANDIPVGVDLYQYIALIHKAVQELADKIDGN